MTAAAAAAAAGPPPPPLLLLVRPGPVPDALPAACCRAAAALPGGASCVLGLDLLRVTVRFGVLPDCRKSSSWEMPAPQ